MSAVLVTFLTIPQTPQYINTSPVQISKVSKMVRCSKWMELLYVQCTHQGSTSLISLDESLNDDFTLLDILQIILS